MSGFEKACDEFKKASEGLNKSIGDIHQLLPKNESFESIQSQTNELVSQYQSLNETVKTLECDILDHFNTIKEQLNASNDSFEKLVDETVNKINQFIEEVDSSFIPSIEEIFNNFSERLDIYIQLQPNEIFSDMTSSFVDLNKIIEKRIHDKFSEIDEHLKTLKTQFIETLEQNISNKLQNQVDDFIHNVIKEISEQIIESTLMVEISTTITSSLVSVTPQLITLKLLTEAIKRALKVLRMGF